MEATFFPDIDLDPAEAPRPSMSGVTGSSDRALIREWIKQLFQKVREVQESINELVAAQKNLSDRVDRLGTAARRLGEPTPEDILCTDCKVNRNSVTLEVPRFNEAFADANQGVPLFQLLCLLTSLSFSLQVENAKDFVSTGVHRKFAPEVDIIRGASGFALLAFAVKGNNKKRAFSSSLGKLFSFYMREAMMSAIRYAREESEVYEQPGVQSARNTAEFNSESVRGTGQAMGRRRAMPSWLIAMHPMHEVRQVVTAISKRMEMNETVSPAHSTLTHSGSPGDFGAVSSSSARSCEEIRAFKRARLSEAVPELGTPQTMQEDDGDMELYLRAEFRKEVVRKLRATWNAFLNRSRTDMRANIHLRLMFLAEYIQDNYVRTETALTRGSGYAAASAAGYEYVFDDASIETELAFPGIIGETDIWKIPAAQHGTSHQARSLASGSMTGPGSNLDKLDRLKENFPCLTVRMRYRREVLRAPRNALAMHRSLVSDADGKVYCKVEETISLHELALDTLVERFKLKDDKSCLAISAMSLRTVHVIAIALRGLLRKSLGLELSDMEKAALGNTHHRHVSIVEDVYTTKLEAARGNGAGNQSVTRQRNNDEKLTISYDKYAKSQIPRTPTVMTLRAPAGSAERASVPSVRDADADWMNGGI